MSEENVIMKTKAPNTVDIIYADLKKLGVGNGDVLLVHSSLSSLGWVCGGAQAVITALLDAVGSGGTLVMPAHSGDWSDPSEWVNPPVPKEWIQTIYDNMPAFRPEITRTQGMGRIAELFRTFPGTVRSNHPQVSFCANGRLAAQITEGHPLTPQFGMDSPLGKLYNLKAKVLLLGVGYGSCTSFHLAEALISEMPVKRMGAAMLESDQRVWKWFEDFAYDCSDFPSAGQEFEKRRDVRKGRVGNAECALFDMQDGVDFAKEWLFKSRFEAKLTRLEGDKTYLRFLEESDAQALLDLYLRNREFFKQTSISRDDDFYTLASRLDSIREGIKLRAEDKVYPFGIFERNTGELIGMITLSGIARGPLQSCMLGYSLDLEHNGRGYTTEAARLAVAYAFDRLGLHRVEAGAMPRNIGSMRVLEKAGFHREGLALKNVKINGKWEDHQTFAIISDRD